MNKTYFISALGYTINPKDEGFKTLKEARTELAAVVKEEKIKAKQKWGKATIVKTGTDRVAIYAMKDVQSPCWGEFWITEI